MKLVCDFYTFGFADYNINAKDLYEYDLNNFVTKQISILTKKSLLGSPQNKLTLLTNDTFGNITEMKVFDYESKQLLFNQKNTINHIGDEVESIGYNGDGSIYSHVKYNYKYDTKGNWILKETLTQDGRLYKEEKRIISYH